MSRRTYSVLRTRLCGSRGVIGLSFLPLVFFPLSVWPKPRNALAAALLGMGCAPPPGAGRTTSYLAWSMCSFDAMVDGAAAARGAGSTYPLGGAKSTSRSVSMIEIPSASGCTSMIRISNVRQLYEISIMSPRVSVG